jgi:hypothetical protein
MLTNGKFVTFFFRNYLGVLADKSQNTVFEMSQGMKEAVTSMTSYPIGQHYEAAVDSAIKSFEVSGEAHYTKERNFPLVVGNLARLSFSGRCPLFRGLPLSLQILL